MHSSRKPRRVFAAPLVMTIAAMPAACVVKTSDPDPKQPETRDHRDPDPTVRDNRDGTGQPPDVVISNPPPPDTVQTDPPKPDPDVGDPQEVEPENQDVPSYRRQWTVSLQDDGTCEAYYHVECKKGRTCNPPPPKKMAKCPDGITMDRPIEIYSPEKSGVCYIEPPAAKCPEKATCNPPPPKKTACPS